MTVKILGITNDVTSCDKCGKQNLKLTVALSLDDTGEVSYYGSDCASYAISGSKKSKKIVESKALAVKQANKWLENGFSLFKIQQGIAERFGYRSGIEGNTLFIGDDNNCPIDVTDYKNNNR